MNGNHLEAAPGGSQAAASLNMNRKAEEVDFMLLGTAPNSNLQERSGLKNGSDNLLVDAAAQDQARINSNPAVNNDYNEHNVVDEVMYQGLVGREFKLGKNLKGKLSAKSSKTNIKTRQQHPEHRDGSSIVRSIETLRSAEQKHQSSGLRRHEYEGHNVNQSFGLDVRNRDGRMDRYMDRRANRRTVDE